MCVHALPPSPKEPSSRASFFFLANGRVSTGAWRFPRPVTTSRSIAAQLGIQKGESRSNGQQRLYVSFAIRAGPRFPFPRALKQPPKLLSFYKYTVYNWAPKLT